MSRRAKQTIMVGGEEVPFRVVRSTGRQRTIALQVQPDGAIVVRAPARTPVARINEVLQRKTAWLSVRRRSAVGQTLPIGSSKEFVAGETFFLRGQQQRLEFVRRSGPVEAKVSGRSLVISAPSRKKLTKGESSAALRACFRREAADVFPQRLERFLSKLGLKASPRLFISHQTRRWGSCNLRGELRLNWRLVGAHLSLVDYVIAHELCHLRWHDHSARFWRELRRVMPDHLSRERELAQMGPDLIF